MRNKCPYRPPQPPRCICRTTSDWLLGVVSPSLMFKATIGVIQSPEVDKYFRRVRAYHIRVIRWKISQRTCSRPEWDSYRRHKYEIKTRRKNHGKTNKRPYQKSERLR